MLSLNPGAGMFACKSLVPLRQGSTLNSRRAACPLMKWVKERWEATDHPKPSTEINIPETPYVSVEDPTCRVFNLSLNLSWLTVVLFSWKIGSRVGLNQTTVIQICERWMKEGTMDRRGQSHPPQCTTSRKDKQIVRMAVASHSVTSRTIEQHMQYLTHHSVYARTIRRRLQQSGQPARRPLLALPLMQKPQTSPPPMGLTITIFQKNNAQPHVARIVQRFFVNHQIELLPWTARFPNVSPIENMWPMVAQSLTQNKTPAVTLGQLWQSVEAAWSDVPQ
ncbi:transposable element Tcb1 transposase [Trichonephila clavipes]|nr:transposable element Tcb1 transposase [Trichonephila clavipes]